MRELYFSARAYSQEGTEYLPAKECGMDCSQKIVGGTGEAGAPLQYEVTITNTGTRSWEGIIHVEISGKREEPRFFMPGFLYGTNRGEAPMEGQRLYPRIRRTMQCPASPWWMVRGDRLSHPAVLVWDAGRVCGFHASPYWTVKEGRKTAEIGRENEFLQYAGFTCHAYGREEEDSEELWQVGYTLGYENAPWLFVDSQDARERGELAGQCFCLDAGETVVFSLYIYDYEAAEITGIHRALENVYQFYHEAPDGAQVHAKNHRTDKYHEAPDGSAGVKESVQALSEAIHEEAWLSKQKAYSLFVFNAPGSEEKEFRELCSFSWTNGLSVAVPMLMSAVRLSHTGMEERARCCIDNIVANCLNPASGLPYDAYTDGKWSLQGWWLDGIKTRGHSGYIVGQGVYYLIKAYSFLKNNRGSAPENWLAFARKVIEKCEKQRNQDGEYPYIMSESTGAGLEYDSLGSAWCMTAALAYMEVTGERSWLENIGRSEEHYYQAYIRQCECYGGPLDISKGIDSEGILAYIRAVAILHRLTGEEKYLRHLQDGLEYELTFKFCYNSPVQVPPLSTVGWCSCGGSITSVVNPHIHPMSSTIVDEMLYFAEQTGSAYIQNRLRDVLLWGCQTYNHYDREYDYGKTGWMSERYCYSQGLLKETYPDGSPASTWFALMPWASASILEGMTGEIWGREIPEYV